MVGSKRPPLPAPTDSLVNEAVDQPSGSTTTDVPDDDTDLSQRTDKSSYSIPEDGRPLTIPTKKIRAKNKKGSSNISETSLLLEYYGGGISGDDPNSRPTVRVKVTPRAHNKSQDQGDAETAALGRGRQPSHVHRVLIPSGGDSNPIKVSSVRPGKKDEKSEALQAPVQGEPTPDTMNQSELSSDVASRNVVLPSDVSSMPADSLLGGPPVIQVPPKERGPSPEKEYDNDAEQTQKDSLKAPPLKHSRTKSKERITKKAIEKLVREQSPEAQQSKVYSKGRPKSGGSDSIAESNKVRSKRSSRSHRDSDLRSGTESSLLPPRDGESNISSGSKISINNPKLLATVEDAIKRLILPEIETIKRNQSIRSTRTRDSFVSEDSVSRSGANNRLSKSTSEPLVKGKETRDDDGSARRRKHRQSARDSVDSSRRGSVDSITEEKDRLRRERRHRRRESSETGLTHENLHSHDSRSSINSDDYSSRRHTGRDRRRSDSIANTEDEYYGQKSGIPPMPMASEIHDSELTRDSLLSADTIETAEEETAQEATRHVPTIREVSRSSPREVASPASRATVKSQGSREVPEPRSTRSRGELSLKSTRSDRSIGSSKAKAAALAAAGLGGAAASLYGHDTRSESSRSAARRDRRDSSRSHSRGHSPVRAERKASGEAKATSTTAYKRSGLSKESLKSSASVDYPLTQKRHKGVNLEREEEVLGQDREINDPLDKTEDDDQFYEKQHALNDEYRSSVEYDNPRDSIETNPWKHLAPGESPAAASFGEAAAGQQLRGVGANAQLIHTPLLAESHVASLAGESSTSIRSEEASQQRQGANYDRQARDAMRDVAGSGLGVNPNLSAERWNALRGHAQNLSQGTLTISDNGSVRELAQSRKSEQPRLTATGLPTGHDPMPEAEYIYDNHSELTDHADKERKPSSVIEGPLGDEYEHRGVWPYEPTPDIETRRGGLVMRDDESLDDSHDRDGALLGTAVGAGLGIGGATAAALRGSAQDTQRKISPREGLYGPRPAPRSGSYAEDRAMDQPKDEGYVTGDYGRSVGGDSPLSFSKPPPKLFDDDAAMEYAPEDLEGDRYSTPTKAKHLSANSHGMISEGYDAATGTGIDHIQSKDIVALMDHLTVRDGHRNARDTEILVTLVRSAADMRESFDEMKKFIETQNQTTIRRADQNSERTINKILSDPRSAPTSTRGIRSTSGSEKDEAPAKKQNIFKRALKGLGSRNEKDLGRMEEMLMQLLDEVEALRGAQYGMGQRPAVGQQRGLDSYERLRAAPESGYEPEGLAGTPSTAVTSGPPSTYTRSGQRMHSGYSYNRDSGNRISTVLEGDEDASNGQNDDGSRTPTQENHRGLGVEYQTPPSAGKTFQNVQHTPNTPRTYERRSRQQSTSSSMFGGIPKISRWSKTTTSSAAEGRASFQKDRPYSEASQSGSEVNVLPGGDDGPYEHAEDDRLRSAGSLARDREYGDRTPGRTPSPLVPDGASMEDPKYRANRHSLTLEHPQPQQGSVHRNPPHLESQAQTYHHANTSKTSDVSQGSPTSPQNDVFGSNPGLARNRFSGGEMPSRSASGRHEGPLVPPKDPNYRSSGQTQHDARPVEDDAESYDSLEDAHYRRSAGQHGNDGQYDSPRARHRYDDDYDSLESDEEDMMDDEEAGYYPEPIPLDRPRSPYSPGGLLEPIEERYSLEQSRLSSPLSRRDTLNSKKTSRIDEETEEEDSPDASPQFAMGGQQSPEGRRKMTGPREMPRTPSGGVNRKPIAGGGF